MADETTTAPAAVTAPVVSAPAARPSAAPKADALDALREVLQPVTDKQKRQERIAKAEAKGANEVLKGLGVKKSERARVMEELKAGKLKLNQQTEQANEWKSRAEKAEADLAATKGKTSMYETLAKQYADEQFASLDEAAQKFIAKQAGDSLDKRLELIASMRESGMLTKQEAAAATAQAKQEAKPPKPANTSNAVNPKAPPPTTTATKKQQWEALKAQNPRIAAQYYAANAFDIDNDWS